MSSQAVTANEPSSTSKKRKRSKNFTELEVRFLVDLVIRYINIVENKKTDAVIWKDKEKTWNRIAQEFEALTSVNRSSVVLRSKYEAIKHTIKSKISKNKSEIFKTGGGSADITSLTDYENKLMGYIHLNVEGLPSQFDSDAEISTINFSTSSLEEGVSNIPTSIPTQCVIICNTETLNEESCTPQSREEVDTIGLNKYTLFQNDSAATSSIERNEQIVTNIQSKEYDGESEKENFGTSKSAENIQVGQWDNWTPKLLKEKKHKKWYSGTKTFYQR